MSDKAKIGSEWEFRGQCRSVPIQEALDLADSFSDSLRAREPVPAWSIALRSLAGAYRRQAEIIDRYRNAEKIREQIKEDI